MVNGFESILLSWHILCWDMIQTLLDNHEGCLNDWSSFNYYLIRMLFLWNFYIDCLFFREICGLDVAESEFLFDEASPLFPNIQNGAAFGIAVMNIYEL